MIQFGRNIQIEWNDPCWTYEKDYTLLKDDNAFNFKVSPYIIRFKKYIKEFNA